MDGDVVDLIMQDHREVERLFDELKSKPDQRPLLVPVLTTLLTAHSRAEEAEVYTVARDEAGEAEQVAHSQQEHAQSEQILARLTQTDPQSSEFDTVLAELVEAVTHHVREEESSVLPGLRERLDDDRRAELKRAFVASREQHLGERPGEATREELLTQARNVGLEGASGMSKDELVRRLQRSS